MKALIIYTWICFGLGTALEGGRIAHELTDDRSVVVFVSVMSFALWPIFLVSELIDPSQPKASP